MNRWTALAAGSLLAAVACGIVTVVQRDECGIEGAYFDRSVGAPSYAGVFNSNCENLAVWNPNFWAGAAIAFALVGVAILVLSRVRRGSNV